MPHLDPDQAKGVAGLVGAALFGLFRKYTEHRMRRGEEKELASTDRCAEVVRQLERAIKRAHDAEACEDEERERKFYWRREFQRIDAYAQPASRWIAVVDDKIRSTFPDFPPPPLYPELTPPPEKKPDEPAGPDPADP